MANSNTNQTSNTVQNQKVRQETSGISTGNTASVKVTDMGKTGETHEVEQRGTVGEQTSSRNQQTTGASKTRTSLAGQVNDATQAAYDKVMNNYTQSPQVAAAYAQLQNALNNKPGAFSSKYESSLNNLYNQIMDRPGFSYNMNNDAMYNIYKDLYQQQGKSAMRDTVAQSAALTGGYNNSYATTAGSQAYQAYLERLNEMVPQLQQNAYNMYRDETNDMYNKANLTQALYQQDYGRYRDQVSDWQKDRDFATNYYNNERNFDYNQYNDNRNFAAQEYWRQREAIKDSNTFNESNTNENSRTDTLEKVFGLRDTTSLEKTFGIERENSSFFNTDWKKTEGDTFTTSNTNTTSNTVSAGSGGSSGGGGRSSGSSGGSSSGNTARSGVTLDHNQRDKLSLDAMDAVNKGMKYEDYLASQVNSGRITAGDYLYLTGNEDYRRQSDNDYVQARNRLG